MDLPRDEAGVKQIQKHMGDLHEMAILLWIEARRQYPDSDFKSLATSIHFTITNADWPADVPNVESAVELCSVINKTKGFPPLSKEQASELERRALELFTQYKSGKTYIQLGRYLIWANRIAYGLGAVSLFLHGFSWWTLGLIIALFWSFGAAKIAADTANNAEDPVVRERAARGMHFTILPYFISLVALYITSLYHLFK